MDPASQTAKLLKFDEQDEICGNALIDLEREQVQDTDYLLQPILGSEAQVCC